MRTQEASRRERKMIQNCEFDLYCTRQLTIKLPCTVRTPDRAQLKCALIYSTRYDNKRRQILIWIVSPSYHKSSLCLTPPHTQSCHRFRAFTTIKILDVIRSSSGNVDIWNIMIHEYEFDNRIYFSLLWALLVVLLYVVNKDDSLEWDDKEDERRKIESCCWVAASWIRLRVDVMFLNFPLSSRFFSLISCEFNDKREREWGAAGGWAMEGKTTCSMMLDGELRYWIFNLFDFSSLPFPIPISESWSCANSRREVSLRSFFFSTFIVSIAIPQWFLKLKIPTENSQYSHNED